MNIRIGNDITLNIALDADKMQDKTLVQAQAYLIRNKRNTRISSPKSNILSDYMIHGCGAPHYFGGVGAFPHDRGFNVCGCGCKNKLGEQRFKLTTSIISDDLLQCIFLKDQQFGLGDYSMYVEVIAQDEEGDHHYTFDYGDVFTFTRDQNGLSGDIVINVPIEKEDLITAELAGKKTLSLFQNTSLSVGEQDYYGEAYNIVLRTSNYNTISYDPDTSTNDLKFISKDPSVATVDERGTITAKPTKTAQDTTIVVYDNDNEYVRFEIPIHVIGSKSDESKSVLTTQVYDPNIRKNQSVINNEVLASVHSLENAVGTTADRLLVVVTSQQNYEEWLSKDQIRQDTFYYTYDADDYPDGPDEPNPQDPGDEHVQDHVLYTAGSVSDHILYVSGTVENHILTFISTQPVQPDEPDTPTSAYIQNNTLHASGSVSGRILTISGTVNNHILTL